MTRSAVGSLDVVAGREVVVVERGQRGYALFGPYIPVQAGRYLVSFHVIASPGAGPDDCCAVVDIAADSGRKILAKKLLSVAESQTRAGAVELGFSIDSETVVEFRVFATGVCGLQVAVARDLRSAPPASGDSLPRSFAAGDRIILSGSSVLGRWINATIRELVALCGPQLSCVDCNDEDGPDDIGRTEGAPRILLVSTPGPSIRAAIRGRSIPVVAIVDDPVDSVRYAQLSLAGDFLHALRKETGCASAHLMLADHPLAYLVRRGASASARAVLIGVLQHVGFDLSDAGRTIDGLGGPEDAPVSLEAALRVTGGEDYLSLREVGSAVPAENAAAVRGALSPLLQAALSREMETITWVRSVFRCNADPDGVAPPVTDITGPARVIFFGPYFHLPAAVWTARFLVAFSQEASKATFRLKVLCRDRTMAEVLMTPPGAGAFECTFVLQHTAPERWIEIQFSNVEGMIEGHVAIGRMEFTRATEIAGADSVVEIGAAPVPRMTV